MTSPQTIEPLDFERLCSFVRSVFETDAFVPLHEPRFWGAERDLVLDCLESTFVSSVGRYVDELEVRLREITGAGYAIATSSGTTALQVALRLAGVGRDDLVVTQPLTFVATCNAVAHLGAEPVFVDVERDTLGLDPDAVAAFFEAQCETRSGALVHRASGRRIAAVVPMHTFGHPMRVERLVEVCERLGVPVVEDAAESLGSRVGERHTGTVGKLSVLSFNGNKIVTSGGGGAILTNDESLARHAKHLTTTAKVAHRWAYVHDEVGYNYRLPNLNAALLCAQLEQLETFLRAKRRLAARYATFFRGSDWTFVEEPPGATSNHWLCAALAPHPAARDALLAYTNDHGVMTRPAWALMHTLPMYRECVRAQTPVAEWLEAHLVNLPSSALRSLAEPEPTP